jgi:hypothetical protein
MAKERVQVPLTFELGWQRRAVEKEEPAPSEPEDPRRAALR